MNSLMGVVAGIEQEVMVVEQGQVEVEQGGGEERRHWEHSTS